MTKTAILTPPKQMKTITTLLNLVRSELFITIDYAERCLEMFISERQSNASLQQFIQALQQIRGSLTLIEIQGAAELTDLMLSRTLSIPADADETWDNTLSALSTSIFTLRRYLENFEGYPDLLSELLIPIINLLRATQQQPALPESYFANIGLTYPPLPDPLPETLDNELFGRLRQMYQIGLIGLIREENRDASLRMMSRALDRLQKLLNNEDAARLCWIASAALESFTDSQMIATKSRKKLFSRVDQQLYRIQINHKPINDCLLKELLYIVSLDDALGLKALDVFYTFNLVPLPYNNKALEAEMIKLAGPGQSAICSFTAAIREELAQTQHSIGLFAEKDQDHQALIEPLLENIEHLIKTLSLVSLQAAETKLKEQIGILEQNKNKGNLSLKILDNLADVILHVEGIILNYEAEASCDNKPQPIDNDTISAEDAVNQYLKQGRTLAFQESLFGITTAQQAIVGYIESKGDKLYLEKLPQILDEIYGCLLFLNQDRAANILRQCSHYINTTMLNTNTLPDTYQLDNLADILASLEFFIETGMLKITNTDTKVLELAEESLVTLDVHSPNITSSIPKEQPTHLMSDGFFTTTNTKDTEQSPPSLLFASTEDEIQAPPVLKDDFTDLDFTLDNFSSFNVDTDSSTQQQVEAPSLEFVEKVSTLTLLAEESTSENEESPAIKKTDNDDISFTRPENWTLS